MKIEDYDLIQDLASAFGDPIDFWHNERENFFQYSSETYTVVCTSDGGVHKIYSQNNDPTRFAYKPQDIKLHYGHLFTPDLSIYIRGIV